MSNGDNQAVQLPSYDEAITIPQSGKQSLLPHVQRQIQDELLDLSIRFQSFQIQRREDLLTNDSRVLNILLQEIRVFLSDYIRSALPKATLILVPAGVIPENSIDALDDLRAKDDFGRLVQVITGGNEKFDSWSGSEMTMRLAAYLYPAVEKIPKQVAQPEPEQTGLPSKSKSSFWKRFSGVVVDDSNVRVVADSEVQKKQQPELPRVSMLVKAEDIIFRVETPFGSYDTASIWGLVVKLQINVDQTDRGSTCGW